MLTDQDLQKIDKLLDPKFKAISKRIDKVDARLNRMDKGFHKRLNTLESRTKKYTRDAAETAVKGFEALLKDHASGESFPHSTYN